MKRFAVSICSMWVLLLALGCDSKVQTGFQVPEARAKSDIRESFGIRPEGLATGGAPDLKVDAAKITIQKSALEKEFLLQANIVQQKIIPIFSGLQSRVVFFRQVDKKVYLIDAVRGLVAPKDYPMGVPIAEFGVIDENESTLTIDFNAGMSRLFIARDWVARDFGDGGNPSLKIDFSYISKALTNDDNALEIHQVAAVYFPTGMTDGSLPVKIVYYLRPYQPNPNFSPTDAPRDMKRMGFFEVATQFTEAGGVANYASKRDISKPVVYALSDNTPAEFRQAVRDGVLYWNKAFGKDVVQVVDAPAGEVAPNPRYNMIQWAEVDIAAFAMADAQMDPRTGEITNQQIFFSSGWRRVGYGEVEDFLKASKVMKSAQKKLGLRGFEDSRICDRDIDAHVAAEMKKLSVEQNPQMRLRLTADLIREVVAHEVGHSLGLRHNFAGSLAANYSLDDREAIFKNYIESGSAPEALVTSSSVMDYQFPMESMLSGDHIAKSPKAAEYDEKAIRTLYYGEKFGGDLPLFCTDSQIGVYPDCMPYDAGASFVSWAKYSLRHNLDLLPYDLISTYIRSKAPSFGMPPREVAEVSFSPKIMAALSMMTASDLVNLVRKDGRLLAIERKFPFANETNETAVRRETVDYVLADLARHGQLNQVLVATTPALIDRLIEKYEALLENQNVIRGVTVEGKPYEFTATELRIMKENGRNFFKRLHHELAAVEVATLGGGNPFVKLIEELFGMSFSWPAGKPYDDSELAELFAAYVAQRAHNFVLAADREPSVYERNTGVSQWTLPPGSKSQNPGGGEASTVRLALPNFTYDFGLRKSAAGMLSATKSENPAWGYRERLDLSEAYESMVSAALPGVSEKDSGTIRNYPRAVVRWILESREIRSAINKP